MSPIKGKGHSAVMALTEDERTAIERHLYERKPAGGMKYQSSLIAILGDARGAADRDGKGRVKPNRRSLSWLGATAYLIMLDQVGKTFKVNGTPDTFGHPIGLAISHFTPVQDRTPSRPSTPCGVPWRTTTPCSTGTSTGPSP
jgi:hypothetical protein